MTSLASSPGIAVVVWAALAIWCGQLVGTRLGLARSSLAERLAMGLVALHAWMMLLDVADIAWTRASLLAPAVLALLLQWRSDPGGTTQEAVRSRQGPNARGGRVALADAMAAASVVAFAWSAWTLRSLAPDFVYHWGVKARHFAAQGGVDWALLQGHDTSYLHPDYPLLIPNLYVSTEILSGIWDEPAAMLWSVLFFAVLILECRRLADEVIGGVLGRVAFATAAAVLSGFSIGHLQAGAADLPFALALLALARQFGLLAQTGRSSHALARIGVWSAFAVICKIEGFPLAAFAIGLAWLRSEHAARRPLPALRGLLEWLRRHGSVWAPSALLGGWWLFTMGSKGLFQSTNSGWPTWERIRLTAEALPMALNVPTWSGLAWLLPLLPLGLLVRRLRWLVLLPCLQVAFYLSSYVGGAQSTSFWVLSSFPRLVFHVMPVLWIAIWAVVARSIASGDFETAKAERA